MNEIKPSHPQGIKQNNLIYLMTLIKENSPVSKRELADLSGLSVVTINKLLPDLLEKKLIYPFSDEVATGGRYAVSYAFNKDYHLLLTIKLAEKEGIMYFYYYLSDVYGQVIDKKELSGEGLEWPAFLETIEEWKKSYPQIKTLTLGIPGVETSGVVKLVDYPMLKDKAVQQELSEIFDCHVTVENDVNAAVLGYAVNQDKKLIISGVYYPVGFPPGGGLSIHQRLLKGKNNFVGEVACLPLTVDWSEGTNLSVDLFQNLTEISQSFVSLYDPHIIVIYEANKRINQSMIDKIELELKDKFSSLALPKLILSRSFSEDYLQGLIHIGLRDAKQQLTSKFN